MKVLFLIDSLVRGGKERRMLELLKGLQQYPDIEIGLVLLSRKILYDEIYEMDIPLYFLNRKYKRDPSIFFQLDRLVGQLKPDIIHSWNYMASIYAIPTTYLRKTIIINGVVTDAPPQFKLTKKKHFLIKFLIPFSSVVVGNSQAGLNIYGVPNRKAYCIHNGFDFKRVAKGTTPDHLRYLETSPNTIIGMIGSLDKRKDFPSYIQAAIQLLEQGTKAIFLICGHGPKEQELQEMVPDQWKENILFAGLIKTIEPIIQLLDIGVLATNSKVHGEGVSNVIMEYMALAKPVVATNGGGTPEIVVDGETGYLVNSNDPADLFEKLKQLLDHPERAKKMGKNGQERVQTHFSLPKMTQEYIDLYQKLVPQVKSTVLKSEN